MSPDDSRHGRTAGYSAGCRCERCVTNHRRRCKSYRARSIAHGGSTLVDAGPSAKILAEAAERMSLSAVGRELNTSHAWISRVISGKIQRIKPERAAAIQRLGRPRPTDTSHVSALGTQRRLQALHAMGYTWRRLAVETGYSLTGLKTVVYGKWEVVEARNAEAVREVYERLSMTLPVGATPHEKSAIGSARNTARKRGWLPPLMWEDPDDPNERPAEAKAADDYEDRVDHAAVWRVVNERSRPRKLTRAETEEVVQILAAKGVTPNSMERDYGVNVWRRNRGLEREAS